MKAYVALAGFWLLLATVPVVAHHAFAAEFDAQKPIKLEGTVTQVEWINPHAWIHIDVKKPDGTVEQWMIEGGTPNTLFRRGVTKNSRPAGTVATSPTCSARLISSSQRRSSSLSVFFA